MDEVRATDIITYIGVPLAVLGVLPIIYTAFRAWVTLRSVRKRLQGNDVTAFARASLLSGEIEVEFPKLRILPPPEAHRIDHDDTISDTFSTLPGGSWTVLRWQSMIVGHKTYRLRYADELRQPQAEIEFEPLLAHLLALGAVPDPSGFAGLKNSGMWAPAGTVLLRWPATGEVVLHTSTSEDSDGVLSLAMKWNKTWLAKQSGIDFVPPYCIELRPPTPSITPPQPTTTTPSDKYRPSHSRVLLRVDQQGLTNAFDLTTSVPLSISHLIPSPPDPIPAATWYATALTALNSRLPHTTTLWSYTPPRPLLESCARSTIPLGILVLSTITPDHPELPPWRTRARLDEDHARLQQQRRMRDQAQTAMHEMRLSPADRALAWHRRVQQESNDFFDRRQNEDYERKERAAQEELDAVKSEKLSPAKVAEMCLACLAGLRDGSLSGPEDSAPTTTANEPHDTSTPTYTQDEKHPPPTTSRHTFHDTVSALLYDMLTDPALTARVVDMLTTITQWGRAGTVPREAIELLRVQKEDFCLAACVLALVAELAGNAIGGWTAGAGAGAGGAGAKGAATADLQGCLAVWKRVRLG